MSPSAGQAWEVEEAEGGARAMKVALEKGLNTHFLADLMGKRWAHFIRHAPPEQVRPLGLRKVSRTFKLSPSLSVTLSPSLCVTLLISHS